MRLPIIRTSERRDFLQCEQKWWWTWREGLRPLGPSAVPLWFGSLVHDALAAYYTPGFKRGPHPAETFAEACGNDVQWMKVENALGNGEHMITEEQLVDANALGISMLEGYVKHWSAEDEHWEIIRAEKTFQLDVPHPIKRRIIGVYCGTYDLVKKSQRTGEYWLGEHKTAKAILTSHLPLDPQAGGYWTVASADLRHAGLMPEKAKLQGIEYNFLRKALPDLRPKNRDGYATNKPLKADFIEQFRAVDAMYQDFQELTGKETLVQLQDIADRNDFAVFGAVSKNQPKALFERETVFRTPNERKRQIERLQDELLRMKPLREGKLNPLKNPGRDCGWCTHFGLCLVDEQGGDSQAYKDAVYEIRDPYSDHRKTTEGHD